MIHLVGAVANLKNLIEFILRPDLQMLVGYKTPLMFSLAHVRKATTPSKFTNMDEIWLNDI